MPADPTDAISVLEWAHTIANRLTTWVQEVADDAAQQIQWQITLSPSPNGTIRAFTCPYKISRAQDGTPQCLIIGSDGRAIPSVTGTTPTISTWALVDNADGSQTLLFGSAPGSGILFAAFLRATQI